MVGNARSAFVPNSAGTATLSATATTGSAALVGNGPNLLVTNAGTATVFVELGVSGVTATVAAGLPILSGMCMALGRPPRATHIAGITASGTATVYVTTGDGD